jgi:hypothetical protein
MTVTYLVLIITLLYESITWLVWLLLLLLLALLLLLLLCLLRGYDIVLCQVSHNGICVVSAMCISNVHQQCALPKHVCVCVCVYIQCI